LVAGRIDLTTGGEGGKDPAEKARYTIDRGLLKEERSIR
jgi:hypothetical protein